MSILRSANPGFFILCLAVLVRKLGGSATITQADIDAVAYNTLEESGGGGQDGITLELKERNAH